jgi:hypothetical protein
MVCIYDSSVALKAAPPKLKYLRYWEMRRIVLSITKKVAQMVVVHRNISIADILHFEGLLHRQPLFEPVHAESIAIPPYRQETYCIDKKSLWSPPPRKSGKSTEGPRRVQRVINIEITQRTNSVLQGQLRDDRDGRFGSGQGDRVFEDAGG